MSRRIDVSILPWTEKLNFQHLPQQGLHVCVTPTWRPRLGQGAQEHEEGIEAVVVDASAEDVAVVMALAGVMSGPDDVPAGADDFEGTYHSATVFRGRSPGWHAWISRAAARAIIRYFEDPELQAQVLGTIALRRFESEAVLEAREREAAVVEAVWRDADVPDV